MQSASNIEIVEKKVDVDQAISHMRRPLDSTSINLEVYGVYSLPESWKSKIEDPTEQLYSYELEVCGISLRNAKMCPRELSEEEKLEQEAAKNVKGKQPPPKDPKKKEEEPSKEEVERVEKERREKEERERKLKEEWDALDEDTKFYRTNEDIYKEPCIKFHNVGGAKRIEQLQQQLTQLANAEDEEQRLQVQEEINSLQRRLFIGNAITQKTGYELIEFEEQVTQDRGVWLKFNKLTPPEEEITDPKAAAAAKKAPPKGGKGAAPEDMKPTFGYAWLSLEDLNVPGGLEIKQRVQLQICRPLVKKTGEDGVERYVEAEEYEEVFENARSYVYLKITLTDPVTPTIPEFPEPLPQEVVPVKQFIKWPFSKDPTEDFKKQISLAIESLAKEYYNMFQNELEAEMKGGKTDNELTEAFEERKKEYLYEINTSGKYHILKEKLKKTIVRIVKEYFKMTGSFKGLNKDERDHFYSTLYAYLVEQMRQTVKMLVQKKKNELHENVTVTSELFIKERDTVIETQTKESLSDRYLRLSYEYEHFYNNPQEAENYMLKYIGMFEGDPEKMLEIGKFYMRIGKPEKANDYLRDSYSFQIKNQNIALTYSCYLISQLRSKEAIIILNKLAVDHYMEDKVYILLSMAYEMDQDQVMSEKYKALGSLIRQRQQGALRDAGTTIKLQPQSQPPIKIPQGSVPPTYPEPDASSQLESKPAYDNQRLSINDFNQLYSEIGQFLLDLGFSQLADKMTSNIFVAEDNKEAHFAVNQLRGKVNYSRKAYEEAILNFETIVEAHPEDIQSLINIGHCYYFLKNYPSAEQVYLKAFRISSFTQLEIQDEFFYNRIGTTYFQQEKYIQGLTFFEEGLLHKKTSYGFFMQGYCSEKSEVRSDRNYSLKSLYQANLMDPNNPDIWGVLSLINVIYYEHNKLFQSLNEAFKLKLSNIPLLKDMILRQSYYGGMEGNMRVCIEYGFRARALKDTMRHQKKCEEFLKAIKDITDVEQIKAKYHETLVKTNCLKEDEDFFLTYLIVDQTRKNIRNEQKILQYQL